jgi:DNA-binding MarR family transcriptional regulator
MSSTRPRHDHEDAQQIYVFVQHLGRRLREIDARAGLTPARYSVLATLRFDGSKNIGELAVDERVKPPSMTRLVRDMRRDGLISVSPDPDDGRGVLVEMTPAAARLFDSIRAEKIALVADYLATLPLDIRNVIRRAFAALEDLSEPIEPEAAA